MKKETKKELRKEIIFQVKCQLDKNGNKYLIDVKGSKEKITFSNIIVLKGDVWSKYPLNNLKVGKVYDIQVSGYKIESNRIALFVKDDLVDLLP